MREDRAGPDRPTGGAIYTCANDGCNLRFPVAPGDRFHHRCPRCGAPATLSTLVAARPAPDPPSGRPPLLPLHLLLDNWRSLFNVGALFRTADGAGVAMLHLCGITPTPDHRKLSKTALGAESTVPWRYAPNAVAQAAALRNQGMQLWVLEAESRAESLFDCSLPPAGPPVVLAAGNEIVGVDPGLAAMADRLVYLPMQGAKRSLNVAVALSVAVYWLRGQARP
ncbi:MAG TPA: TrmH family RNA methyltransferase [Caldilineaceae bacterium]|nr:TrmH family RNA methyltransferase [Caldilineaceae bacterium]